jgi:hypothetical protein
LYSSTTVVNKILKEFFGRFPLTLHLHPVALDWRFLCSFGFNIFFG